MRLRSLTLRNFRVYADETIDFGTGLIGIVGNNGAGKSSIVEAICLALYGTREVLSGKRPPRREGCPDGEDYEVSLTVDITGDQYTVSRYGNKPSRLQRGSEKAITGEKRVNAELQRLLGLSFDGFKTAFVALQGELNTLARHSSEPRRQLVCDMLGITRIDDAHGLAVKHRNDLQRDLRHLQLAIADLPKARRDLETAERTIADKTTELTTTRATHAAVSSEVVRATAIIDLITAIEQQAEKIGALEKQRQETESLGGRIQQLRDQLAVESTLRDEHAFLTRETQRKAWAIELTCDEEQRTAVERGRSAWTQRVDTAQKAYDAFAKEIETLGKDGQRRRDDVERLKGEATEILQRVAALNGTVAEQDRLFQADRTSLANVKKLGPATPCPTCRVPLGTNFPDVVQRLEQVIRERGETLAGLRGQITQFDRRVKKINQDRVTIEQAVPPLGQLDAILRQKEIDLRGLYQKLAAAEQAAQGEEDRLIALAEQIDTLRAQIGNEPLRDDPVRLAAIEAELQTLQGLTGELKAALEQQLNLRSVDAIDADLTALRDARDQKLQRVKELWQPTDPFVDDAPAWQEWRQSLTQTRDDWAAHIRAGELEVARAEEQVKILGPHVADLDEKARAYELAARTHRRMGVIVAVLTTLRTNIMGGIRPALERYTSQLLAAVSNGTYQHVRIDEDYQVQVEGLYGFHPANQYSGGEHDLVNFCFRIAISRHLLDTVGHYQTCVVLDEMFGSQDPDRRFALRQYIKQLSRLEAGGHFQQIILISHIPDVLDDCDQLLSIDHDATTGMSRLSSEANALVREAVAMLPG